MPKKTFLRLEEDKQERIVRAAIGEFHANGFEKAKIGTIAEQAGIAKGSIYQYFDDKKELFLYAVQWSMEYFMKEINRYEPLKEMDVFDYLLSDGRKRIELVKRESTLMMFYQDIMAGKYGGLTEAIYKELWKIGDRYILQLITVGKKKGTIREELDDHAILLFYKGVTSQIDEYVFGKTMDGNFDLSDSTYQEVKAMIDKMIGLMKHGMGC